LCWQDGAVTYRDPTVAAAALRAAARVDLGAISSNVLRIKEIVGPAEVMAVVKAEGYGHGLVQSALAAVEGGATWLGVAFLEEALALRAAGLGGRILCWLGTPGEPIAEAIAADIDVSASAPWAISEIANAALEVGRVARVHLKIDTGLSRGGASQAEWPELLQAAVKARAEGYIEVVGMWSHLVHGSNPAHPTTALQIALFNDALSYAASVGVTPQVRHLANSGGALLVPGTRFDLVRPGLAVYGLSPVPDQRDSKSFGLRPAMTLTARLALTKKVPAGTGVSYSHRYITTVPTTLGLVPLGYADGIARAATNRAEVLVRSRLSTIRRTISGTVCMDQFVVDLGPGENDFAAGDEVVLFGPGDRGEPTAQDWADACDTISYEIVTRIGVRVPRVYEGA
jgi:alanine racemase